jgi:hypothetical protein
MPGSDLTDRTRTGPFVGSHLSDTVRRTGPTAVRRTVPDRCEPRNEPVRVCPSPDRGLSVSGPLDLNRALIVKDN